MDYIGSKSPKITKRYGLRPPRPSFCLNNMKMCKTLLPLKLLVDAEDWSFLGKTKLIFYIFCPPVQKNVLAPLLIIINNSFATLLIYVFIRFLRLSSYSFRPILYRMLSAVL